MLHIEFPCIIHHRPSAHTGPEKRSPPPESTSRQYGVIALRDDGQVQRRGILQQNHVHVGVLQIGLSSAPLGMVRQHYENSKRVLGSHIRHSVFKIVRGRKAKVCIFDKGVLWGGDEVGFASLVEFSNVDRHPRPSI